jgi:Na+-translocating ferredoxin:NAD+ oxidoreductase RnfC subunit
MRSLLFSAGGTRTQYHKKALLCIECNICSLYACPEDLDPKSICADSKRELLSQGIRPDKNRELRPNPVRNGRQVPTSLLTRKLGLAQYESSAPLLQMEFSPDTVRIPLRQHLGNAATAIVNPGERVGKGQLIGDIPLNTMGAKVHSSIDGIIESVDSCVTIRKSQ